MTYLKHFLILVALVPLIANPQTLYKVEKGDTLSEIAEKFYPGENVYKSPGPLKSLLKSNDKIQNPDLIFPEQEIIIPNVTPQKVDPLKGELITQDTVDDTPKSLPREIHDSPLKNGEYDGPLLGSGEAFTGDSYLFGFYTASRGNFTESSLERKSNIEFLQNSYITLGVLYGKRIAKKYNLSLSLYASKLNTASLDNGQDNDIEIPLEIGSNAYLETQAFKNLYLYGGIDYEQFSSVDMPRLINDNTDFALIQNKMGFATVGTSFYYLLGKKRFIAKASLAQSIFSTAEKGMDPYQGLRYQFFLSYAFTERFSLSALYKIHVLEASDRELDIDRIGLGIGYRFF